MKLIEISDHLGEPPDARTLAIENNDLSKREALAEYHLAAAALELVIRRLAMARLRAAVGYEPGRWMLHAKRVEAEHRLERAKAALADAPGGERCKR